MRENGLRISSMDMELKHGQVKDKNSNINILFLYFYILDGAKYEGQYEMGKKHGKGKFIW